MKCTLTIFNLNQVPNHQWTEDLQVCNLYQFFFFCIFVLFQKYEMALSVSLKNPEQSKVVQYGKPHTSVTAAKRDIHVFKLVL